MRRFFFNSLLNNSLLNQSLLNGSSLHSDKLSRLYDLEVDATLTLPDDVYHHWCRVLRAKIGDHCVLFDGLGGEIAADLIDINKKSATVRILTHNTTDRTSAFYSTISIVMSRGDRMDFAIQKSTELGATAIQLLTSQYGEVRLKDSQIEKKLNHWQQVALSASEQCGLNRPTLIFSPISIEAWLDGVKGELHDSVKYLQTSSFYQSYMSYDAHSILPLIMAVPNQEDEADINVTADIVNKFSSSALNDTHTLPRFDILIGAEGGFSNTEYKLARDNHYLPWQLGNRILRTETAPVVAISTLLSMSSNR